ASSNAYTLSLLDALPIYLHIRLYYSGEEGAPVTIPQGITATLLDFTHSGPLPKGTSVSMTASEEMQNGYLYYVNEENGTFEYIRSEEHTSELQSRFDLVC